MSISADEIRQLAARTEDRDLDFKEDFYGNDKESNSEMAKDIMAIANSLQAKEVGYILFGVAEHPDDRTGIIKGLIIPPWITDSNLQQKVHSLLNRPPEFSWSTIQVDGSQVGVITIRAGGRPFFPLKTAHSLQKYVAFRRAGSSTTPASPDEIVSWSREDDLRRSKDLEIERIEQQLALLPRLKPGVSLLSANVLNQTIEIKNDGHALFLVDSAKCTWRLRVPNWFAPELQTTLQPMMDEIPPLVFELEAPEGTIKEGAGASITFLTKLEKLRNHFDGFLIAIAQKAGTNTGELPDLLHGIFSVDCRSPVGPRTATTGVDVRWRTSAERLENY